MTVIFTIPYVCGVWVSIANYVIFCLADDDEADAGPVVDAFDLIEPEEILSKLPKDFYESMVSEDIYSKEYKWKPTPKQEDRLTSMVHPW